ncbi:MAG: hypothetical protein U0Q16_04190 [Bryobacteraceae bacterium]
MRWSRLGAKPAGASCRSTLSSRRSIVSIGGKEKWDLIVFSYFFPQEALPRIYQSLKPGGVILIEGCHADTAHVRPVGGGYSDKQMFAALAAYRILIFEDVEDKQDWGRQYGDTKRPVRVLAQKPGTPIRGCTWKGSPYREGEGMCWAPGSGHADQTGALGPVRYSRCRPCRFTSTRTKSIPTVASLKRPAVPAASHVTAPEPRSTSPTESMNQ